MAKKLNSAKFIFPRRIQQIREKMRIGRIVAIIALIGIVTTGIVDYHFGRWDELRMNGFLTYSQRDCWGKYYGYIPITVGEELNFEYRVIHHGLFTLEVPGPHFAIYQIIPEKVEELYPPKEIKVFEHSGEGATLGRWDEKSWEFSFTPENSGSYYLRGRSLTNGAIYYDFKVD